MECQECQECQAPPEDAGMREVRTLIHSLKHSPSREGFVTLCQDGVLRNFSSSGEVVDYKVLNPEQISSAVRLFTLNELLADQKDHLEKAFKGVDGRDVPEEKLMKPDLEIIPEELRKGSA
ncbi:uncharacterized protein CDV56_104382 [Aspergillus thermomutatus]|uniref:Uncharacterized protein n=1 Tax=Aspergillus thermomutatus TaxID=41047 RepID=A0A397H7J8_ASPTH|nr:uncharacterized protein CDV56_104382 [Aspergillus thermomutatus]RHZ57393.1 hypothetical protein CDV56_104382 [Aspergillus thermomutatus]